MKYTQGVYLLHRLRQARFKPVRTIHQHVTMSKRIPHAIIRAFRLARHLWVQPTNISHPLTPLRWMCVYSLHSHLQTLCSRAKSGKDRKPIVATTTGITVRGQHLGLIFRVRVFPVRWLWLWFGVSSSVSYGTHGQRLLSVHFWRHPKHHRLSESPIVPSQRFLGITPKFWLCNRRFRRAKIVCRSAKTVKMERRGQVDGCAAAQLGPRFQ